MNVITMRNSKGGVGKTNLAISISTYLNLEGFKVALIDTEEFGIIEQIFKSKERKSLLNSFKDEINDKIKNCSANYKHLNMYVQQLAYIERALGLKVISHNIENGHDENIEILGKKLRELEEEGYDYVVIDTPGKNISSVENVCIISDLVLMPQKDTVLDFKGVVKSLDKDVDLSKYRRVIWEDKSSCFESEDLIEQFKVVDSFLGSLSSRVYNSIGFNRALNKCLGVCEMNRISSGKDKISTNKASEMIADIVKEIKQMGV